MENKKPGISQCEICAYYDDYEEECEISLDEDDLVNFITRPYSSCPYFQIYDEYKIVKKQN